MSGNLGHLPYFVMVWLFACGLYGVATSRNFVHLIICLGVLQSATYVLLVAIGYRTGAAAPVFYHLARNTPVVDPLVQALMLTDIVVEATVVALLLAITVKIHRNAGTADPHEVDMMRG